jgi:hypothetical protein
VADPTLTIDPTRTTVVRDLDYTPWSLQRKILESTARYIVVPAGTGTGKTSVGPYWLFDRIKEHPRDEYLVVAADDNSCQGQFVLKADGLVRVFCDQLQIGTYVSSSNLIHLKTGGTVYIRSAKAPRTLHSIHARAVWLDEAGLIDDMAADVALGRAAQKNGQYLVTGYPQSTGGWYQKLIERGENGDLTIEVLRVPTELSPYVARATVEEARLRLPSWKFAMIWEGAFCRALGSVFDPLPVGCIHDLVRLRLVAANVRRNPTYVPTEEEVAQAVASTLQMYGGADGGWAVTAGVLVGRDPTTKTVYWLGGMKTENQPMGINAAGMKSVGMGDAVRIFGDPAARSIWTEYQREGLRIADAIKGPGSVEAGLSRMIGMVRNQIADAPGERFVVDRCAVGIAEFRREWDGYRWVTDGDGNIITDKLGHAIPVKEHLGDDLIDSTRYVITSAWPATGVLSPARIGRGPYSHR